MMVTKYDISKKNDWNNFIMNARNSTFLFNRDFLDYHASRFTDYSLMVFDNKNEISSLLPANILNEKTVVSHQGLTYGGLVYKKMETLAYVMQYFKCILKYLNENNIDVLRYKELPQFYNAIPSEEIQYALFLLNASLTRRDTTITINQNSRLPFQKRRNRSIKEAIRNHITIIEESSFDLFWNNILIPNLQTRYNVKPVHSVEEITRLNKDFPNNIKQFNAYCDSKIMAGVTIFETDKVAHTQYIAASPEGKDTGSLDFLLNYLIVERYNHKSFFDFGICNEDNGLKLNYGLVDWKEGFGGRAYSHNFYDILTKNYKSLDKD